MVSRRDFIKIGVAAVAGAAVTSAVELPLLKQGNPSVAQFQSPPGSLAPQVGHLQTGFLALNPVEQGTLEAVAETMIPTDANGPGAKEAGVIYFIDRQLASDYGNNANVYTDGPFVPANQSGPITVDGILYPAGSAVAYPNDGIYLNYPFNMREFWRRGLEFLDSYAKTAYGAGVASLTGVQQGQVLQDLWNNKPTNFQGPTPQEFFVELHFMVWSGFLTDPLYGGNRGMVGWKLTGFNGTNSGNAYGEGYDSLELALMTTPVRLQPQSLAQLQGGA